MSPGSMPLKSPQAELNNFWAKFSTKKPSKVTSIFPRLLYASLLPEHPDPRGISSARNAAESYEAVAQECRDKVARIKRECYRTNEKFTDSDFDIESDFDGLENCLNGLEYNGDDSSASGSDDDGPQSKRSSIIRLGGRDAGQREASSPNLTDAGRRGRLPPMRRKRGVEARSSYTPGSIHRLEWIFKNPQFTIDGFSSSDIQQGGDGDCWWLAAVATIAHRSDLMNKICVARDEECGIYGFVFYRDGEWVSTVVDDNLYLLNNDFRDYNSDVYDPTGEKARKYRLQCQTGSEALYFGHCSDPNETWLPLMEKAYAKIHGDYDAISGGWSGEAVEDMTGGVTTTISTKRVLRKDALWKDLAYNTGDFVFALSAMGTPSATSGVVLGHAYSILNATEEVDEDGSRVRLVKIRNPWGKRSEWSGLGEWNGRWSDGSSEWTPYWMKKLDHRFGDDGIFWMLYEDMLEMFKFIHRTRLFDEKWTVMQQWTSCDVSWITGYSLTKFVIDIKTSGMVVIVLSQLDDRFFKGLEGQYDFELHFVLKKENSAPGDYECRVRQAHEWENRSVSCEIDLEPGRYEVLPKITATRHKKEPSIEKLVRYFADRNPQKLRQVGMQYDLAHSKGGIPDEDLKIEAYKAKKKKSALEQKKKGKATKVRLELDIDIPPSSSSLPSDLTPNLEGKTPINDGEIEEFEDAAENLEKGDGEKTQAKAPKRGLTIQTKRQHRLRAARKGNEVRFKNTDKQDDEAENDEAENDEAEKDEAEKDEAEKDEGKNQGDKDENEEESENKEKNDEEEDDDDKESESEDKEDGSRWNAVCVVCLKVYSRDPDLTIALVKSGVNEEASSLTQGGEPAGATM